MASRRIIFVVSLLIGCSVYGALFVAAPRIILLRADSTAENLIEAFRVDLREVEPQTEYVKPSPDERSLSSEPGSLRDLLEREDEQLQPEKGLFEDTATVPRLAERLASDALSREHDFEPDEQTLSRVDAKVVEIAERTARGGIEVVRRLVQPSPDRTLEPEEAPSLRGTPTTEDTERLALPDLPTGVGGVAAAPTDEESDTGGDTEMVALEPSPRFDPLEPMEAPPEPPEEGLPELPIEAIMAREPVQQDVREESNYEFIDDLVRIELDTYVEDPNEAAFFRVRIRPRNDGTMDVLPKDVTFVVDASKSIMQRKLKLTARGLQESLAQLRPRDRFNVVLFRERANAFQRQLTPATPEAITEAQNFLEGLESRGETDVYNSLKPVMEQVPREGAASMIVMASDGRPTTGVMNGRDIINSLTEANRDRNTVYAFGGGNTVNQYLLDLLAYRNKGVSRVASDMNDIDTVLPDFFQEFDDPILVNLSADFGRIPEASIYPKEIPDFYLGRVVTVYGRYEPGEHNEFVMRLQGEALDRQKEVIFKADLTEARTGDAAIARNWAFQKTYYLIGEMTRVGETPELLGEIRALSQRYDIQTSYAN